MISILFQLFFLLNASKVEWLSPMHHDFDDLRRGAKAEVSFKFKNTTDEPFVIDAVRTTCGCTAASYPEVPILPGETDAIVVEYDTNKSGYFNKKIKVFFHGQRRPEVLSIEGTVE